MATQREPSTLTQVPPCLKPLSELWPIKPSDLRPNAQHLDGVLFLSRNGSASFKCPCMTVNVKDETGADAVLQIVVGSMPDESIFPDRLFAALKQPLYRSDEYGARLFTAHPSDLLLLQRCDELIPRSMRSNPELPGMTAKACKGRGDNIYAGADQNRLYLLQALDSYSNGLIVAEAGDSVIRAEILQKRASVCHDLGRYDQAMQDALESLDFCTSSEGKYKAYCTVGRAAYCLCDFAAAEQSFISAVQLQTGDQRAGTELTRVRTRLREQAYDFDKISANLSEDEPRVDAASFTRKTEVKESPGRGLGLFAKQDIEPGDLVLCEKAIYSDFAQLYDPSLIPHSETSADPHAHADNIRESAELTRKLYDNPSLIPSVVSLHAGNNSQSNTTSNLIDGHPIIDFRQVYKIFCHNNFEMPTPSNQPSGFPYTLCGESQGGGLWTQTSRANHSCLPNAKHSFMGDMIILKAQRKISTGDEIFITYLPGVLDFEARQKQCIRTWHFECKCPVCQAEKQVSPELRAKRDELLKGCHQFEDVSMEKSEKYTRLKSALYRMQATYNDAIFDSLPRLELHHILHSMAHEIGNDGELEDVLLRKLRAGGHRITIKGDAIECNTSNAIFDIREVRVLVALTRLQARNGDIELAQRFEDLTKEAYEIVNGTMDGYELAKNSVTHCGCAR